jgi:retron-type reverse transcriptase
VTSVLNIGIKGAFDNVHKGIFLKTMSDMNLPEASMRSVYHFISRRRTSLITNDKKADSRQVDLGIPQGSPISPLLFQIYISSLYKKIKEADLHVLGFVDDINIYTGSRDVEKTLKN